MNLGSQYRYLDDDMTFDVNENIVTIKDRFGKITAEFVDRAVIRTVPAKEYNTLDTPEYHKLIYHRIANHVY